MLADPMFLGAFADVHVDSQFALIDYDAIGLPRPEAVDSGHILSVTIAIDLPASGGGLFHWDLEKTRADHIPSAQFPALLGPETRRWYPYTLGTVVLHSGLKYHQIACWDDVQPDDARITLQGHAVLSDGIWTLYW